MTHTHMCVCVLVLFGEGVLFQFDLKEREKGEIPKSSITTLAEAGSWRVLLDGQTEGGGSGKHGIIRENLKTWTMVVESNPFCDAVELSYATSKESFLVYEVGVTPMNAVCGQSYSD